ncbi:unnamed protein product [Rotaria sp. Silwood1]|nr:unnamed protein product [Rotaria sp. Silwood1]CAF1334030.1 unnamed protein product [Rotaria sp. Silwood1]CAF3503472.1 unnamed protein product [Rotaria sp. Silwood1]CAF3560390.1 unnamed protein product [Rotaria sp. Silwood1]CAF4592091.1 unnamed protein product [Rotaria sp. Silwood1]
MTASCPGFLDRYGIWNNGFDCSSPRICCGTETDRYCCIPSKSSSSLLSQTSYQSSENLVFHTSNSFLSEKWFFFQICTAAIFLAIILLMFVIICQCLTSIRRNRQRQQQRIPIVQVPVPASVPLLIEHNRSVSNRISTISSTPSDTKSRCTDTSTVFNTPLNLYPTANNRNSTSTSSSYYMFPNEFEHLCK